MAPSKKPYKVHSLSQHVQDTQKGISADAQYNRRTATAAALKKNVSGIDPTIFGNNDDDSNSDSDDSSDGEDQTDFLSKLAATSSAPKKPVASVKKEVFNSDAERKATIANQATTTKKVPRGASSSGDESASESESTSDSDSSSSTEEKKPSKLTKPATNGTSVGTTTTTTSPTSSSGEEESSDEEEDAPNANGAKIQTPVAIQKSSSESESESESDSESESESTTKKPANGKLVTIAKADNASSESDSNDEPANPAEKPARKLAVSQSGSESEESASESDDNAAVDESMHISDREESGQLAEPKFIAPDFMIRRGNKEVDGKDVAEICNQANLQGKQFWYFTVPADIPISVVQNMEIPLDATQRGDSVFSHNGDSYGVSFDDMTPKSTIQILIPSTDGVKYRAAPRSLDQVVQIKRIANLGGPSTGTADPTYKRPVRAQPKGLKARYKPIGVSNPVGNIGEESDDDDADTEMADAPSLPTLPAAAEPSKQKKQHKSKTLSEAVAVDTTPKKSKKSKDATDSVRKGKRKLTTSDEDTVAASSQLMGESQVAETKSKKQRTDRAAGSPDLSTKATPITIPLPSYSVSGHPAPGENGTPNAVSKKAATKKKADKTVTEDNSSTALAKKSVSKVDIPLPPISQTAASRNTPIAPPVIHGQPIPSSSAPTAPLSTPTPAPVAKTKKTSRKKKDATQVQA